MSEILHPTHRLARHYAKRVAQLQSRFDGIRDEIDHQGAKGTRVEGELRKMLVEFMPSAYEYGSGIVIDSSGNEADRSKQQDILVVDKLFNPRLFLDEEPTVYPVEVLFAGIEVGSSVSLWKRPY